MHLGALIASQVAPAAPSLGWYLSKEVDAGPELMDPPRDHPLVSLLSQARAHYSPGTLAPQLPEPFRRCRVG
jgi:hypothetical protein